MTTNEGSGGLNKHISRNRFMDDAIEQEVNNALGGMSLDDIMDGASSTKQSPSESGLKRGTVVGVDNDAVIVDLGGKNQGMIPVEQFESKLPAVGDKIEFTIEGFDNAEGLMLLSRRGAVMAAAWETLHDGQIVEGRVTAQNKGGLELDINGIRAFMPVSQIEMFRVTDLTQYMNQRIRCQISEIDRQDQNVIVSRRALLELESQAARDKAWETLQEGMIVPGVVRSIMPYGAFVDIGGLDGLLHVREMSHCRVDDPRSILTEGQNIQVKVLKIDKQDRKISLGLKQTMADPWDTAEANFRVDSIVAGKVAKIMDFGAFVELQPGVEGLIPISEMSYRRIGKASEIVNPGDSVRVRVMKVDTAARRISLSIKKLDDDPWMGASARWPVNSVVEGKVTRVTDFGAFVELAAGVEGLVHISELSHERVKFVAQAAQVGQLVKTKVLSVDEDARRISLSIKQAAMAEASSSEAHDVGSSESQSSASSAKKRKKPLKGGLD